MLFETQGLSRSFGGLKALSEVDFQLEAGAIGSVIGPNGAGKTTFFNVITGNYPPSSGAALFEGKPLPTGSAYRVAQHGIARTFQNIRLFGNLSATENVLIGMEANTQEGVLKNLWRGKAAQALEAKRLAKAAVHLHQVGLADSGSLLAKNLPYGHQRLLEIARAIAGAPRLLLLDEPAAGMNPRETTVLMELIRRLRDELNLTILLIEHDMRLVMDISDVILVLDHGQRIALGTPQEVAADPKVIEAYLGAEAD